MTRGALIFAFNNDQIDYLAMAAWSARNIHRHLEIPVCVVTNAQNIPAHYEFDQVVRVKEMTPGTRHLGDLPVGQQVVKWYNGNRVDAYDISPWDQTLVLDADYVVASDQLKVLFNIEQDFLAHRWAYDVSGQQPFDDLNYFGRFQMPMWWATVMMFQRSRTAELIFGHMQMIRQHWSHYKNLYQNSQSTYRNDHALTIALNTVNGHVLNHAGIPWDLASLVPTQRLEYVEQDCYKLTWLNPQRQYQYLLLQNQDFHAMGKRQLGEIVESTM